MNLLMRQNRSASILIVSASDEKYFSFLRAMLSSLGDRISSGYVDFACFDIGMSSENIDELGQYRAKIAQPHPHFGSIGVGFSPAMNSFLARAFLPEYFPGYEVYVWIDSDVWLQDVGALDVYIHGAHQMGLAISHEAERGYRFRKDIFAWTAKHMILGYGYLDAAFLLTKKHLNAGIFAMTKDAWQWNVWRSMYSAAVQRSGALVPHDQFSLNQCVYGHIAVRKPRLQNCVLSPEYNWICEKGTPMWNHEHRFFCKPYFPFEKIQILHLAGRAKWRTFSVKSTDGTSTEMKLTYPNFNHV